MRTQRETKHRRVKVRPKLKSGSYAHSWHTSGGCRAGILSLGERSLMLWLHDVTLDSMARLRADVAPAAAPEGGAPVTNEMPERSPTSRSDAHFPERANLLR